MVIVPTSPPGVHTEASPIGGNVHQSVHIGKQGKGGLSIDLAVVHSGKGGTGSTNYGGARQGNCE